MNKIGTTIKISPVNILINNIIVVPIPSYCSATRDRSKTLQSLQLPNHVKESHSFYFIVWWHESPNAMLHKYKLYNAISLQHWANSTTFYPRKYRGKKIWDQSPSFFLLCICTKYLGNAYIESNIYIYMTNKLCSKLPKG